MQALVIGGSGFIGSHVVRALNNAEIETKVLFRASSSLRALVGTQYTKVVGDLEDRASILEAMKGCQVVFHVGGYYPLYSLNRTQQIRQALGQMENVLKAVQKSPHLKKMIYTSSLSTIGISETKTSNEETPYDPKNFKGLYHQIKYEMEQAALDAARHGLPITVLNPTVVLGDNDIKPTSGMFLIHLAKERTPFTFDAKINVVDAIDVAEAHVRAIAHGKIGDRYILGGHNTTLWELSQWVAKAAHKKPPMVRLPLWAGDLIASASEIVGKYLLRQKKPWFPKLGMDFLKTGTHYDSQKAQKELELHRTPLNETLERALHWFQSHGYL